MDEEKKSHSNGKKNSIIKSPIIEDITNEKLMVKLLMSSSLRMKSTKVL